MLAEDAWDKFMAQIRKDVDPSRQSLREWLEANPLPILGEGTFMRVITEREKFLSDVLTTAVEGAINYWAMVSNYDLNGPTPTVTVHELSEDGGDPLSRVPITITEIGTAINRIIAEDLNFITTGTKTEIFRANVDNDAGDIDAELADIIMQVAVIGEVRYG